MLQDPSQFAEHIDAMLKQSLGVGDAEIEEEEEMENVPEAENAEDEADQDNDEDEDKSSKDELWMNVLWIEKMFGVFVFETDNNYGQARWKSCYTVKWNLNCIVKIFCFQFLRYSHI